jgi:hypothetical protein
MSESGLRRMRVSVDEARENSFPAEIDFLGTTGCEGEDFLVGAAGMESPRSSGPLYYVGHWFRFG